MMDITLRGPNQKDSSFIVSSWLRSTREQADSDIELDVHYKDYRQFILNLLETDPIILIACSKEDPDYIMGYAVHDDNVLYYMYVRYALRRQGVGKKLLKEMGDITHITHKPLWWHKDDRIKGSFKYNPYLFIKPKEYKF